MVQWRAIGSTIGLFVILLVITLAYESDLFLLTIGLPCGLVIGYQVGGVLWGTLYGLVTGIGIGLFLVVSVSYIAFQGRVGPGAGLGVLFVALIGLFLAIQSTVGGAIGGVLKLLVMRFVVS